jgi:Cu(I)/Ag(I) efflux system membrane fusion protein
VRVTLSNPAGRLKIGMFANMTIAASATGALVVPSEAVISTGKRDVVIVQRHDAFIPVEVEPGRTVGDKTEIRRGLSPNDVVVVSGQFLIDSEASLAGVIQRLQRSAAPATQQEKPVEGRGVIRAIDAAGLAITLSHEPIATIGWPGMTMRFPVRDASLLRGRKAGQGVRFFFDRPAQGETPVIDRIEHGRAQ